MELIPNNGSLHEANDVQNEGSKEVVQRAEDSQRVTTTAKIQSGDSPSLDLGSKPSKDAGYRSLSMEGVGKQPIQSESDFSAERSRAPHFNKVVDVVYYDSKQCLKTPSQEMQGRLGMASTVKTPRDVEFSVCGSSDDRGDHGSYVANRSSSYFGGRNSFSTQQHTVSNEQDLMESGLSMSYLEPKEAPLVETYESLTFPGSCFLPKWAKTSVAYIAAVNRDRSEVERGPSQMLHRRFRSFRPLMFKSSKLESEFADLNLRKMPLQVAMGSLFLTFIFIIHFLTLRSTISEVSGIVVGELFLSVALAVVMVTVCFGYCFRKFVELTITIVVGLLFSLRASVLITITATSIDVPRLEDLGFFAYNIMGFAENVLLLIIPYHLATIRYMFCFWLTFLVVLWIFPMVGLSAKVAVDMYRQKETGYLLCTPVITALLAGLVLTLDQSRSMQERKKREVFWRLKTAEDRLEIIEGQVLNKEKRKPVIVPITPLESAINNLDLIQAMLCNSQLLNDEKEHLQDLLNEAKHNLTFTDNIYQFNAETCNDEFAKSYVSDLRREGISKPRKLSRKTSLAVRRKSRVSGFVDTSVLKAIASRVGLDWSFDCFSLERISQKPLYDVGYAILSPFFLSPDISLNRNVLCNFLDELSNQYLDNPYHNALHGATVCHMTLCLLEMLSVRELMNDLEDIAAGIASLCHDVGHPGRNNNFMIAANTPLAITYNDSSVLENHHASLTFHILSKPKCNILEKVATCTYRAIRKYIIEWILATDMKQHFDHISSFRTRRMNGEFDLANSEEDRSRIVSMCIKAADLGHAATVWEQHEEWCRRVVTEFYDQGDEEERLGLPKSFLCDRSNHEKEFIPSQIGFITFVVKPLYEELKSVDDMLQLSTKKGIAQVCIVNLDANAAHWQRREKGLPD